MRFIDEPPIGTGTGGNSAPGAGGIGSGAGVEAGSAGNVGTAGTDGTLGAGVGAGDGVGVETGAGAGAGVSTGGAGLLAATGGAGVLGGVLGIAVGIGSGAGAGKDATGAGGAEGVVTGNAGSGAGVETGAGRAAWTGAGAETGRVTGTGAGAGRVTGAEACGAGGALGAGLVLGITRGRSGAGLVRGNAGGGLIAGAAFFSPPGGVAMIGGGAESLGLTEGNPVDDAVAGGILGPVGFFGPNTRESRPGFFSGSAGDGSFIAELAAGVGPPGIAAFSLSRSPKMRLRIGRFFSSFGGSGSVDFADGGPPGISPGFGFAFGGSVFFAGDGGASPSGLS
jgi:hypothetical protein